MTKTKSIGGQQFELTAPYAEGHVITEAEAKALNQVRSENIGNNLRDLVKKAVEEGKPFEEIAAAVAKYDSEYVFNLAAVSQAAKYTPEEKMARKIAREQLTIVLANKGLGWKKPAEGYDQAAWDAKMEENITRVATREDVVKAAKKALDLQNKRKTDLAETIEI